MALADIDDVNTHLPLDKAEAKDGDPNIKLGLVDAERIIKGQLAGHIAPATLAAWAAPGTTPAVIRAIAGRLVAAIFYAKRFAAQRSDEVPAYAQEKYNEAMLMLQQIITGQLQLDGVVVIEQLSDTRFWPNDTTPPPKFNMALDFS